MNHIDVSSVLRGTVSHLYSNLVTRSTGAAVRTEIEHQLAMLRGRTVNVIDFSHVGLLDFSCADEVVAKLLMRYDDAPPVDAYFLFRGVSESHLDAIEAVLERRGLALVVQLADGAAHLIGAVDEKERAVWETLCSIGTSAAADIAQTLGVTAAEVEATVDRLCRRRLVMRLDEVLVAIGGVR